MFAIGVILRLDNYVDRCIQSEKKAESVLVVVPYVFQTSHNTLPQLSFVTFTLVTPSLFGGVVSIRLFQIGRVHCRRNALDHSAIDCNVSLNQRH